MSDAQTTHGQKRKLEYPDESWPPTKLYSIVLAYFSHAGFFITLCIAARLDLV
jgi:hypothetical protein